MGWVNSVSIYRVTGIFNYRGHAPGTVFIANLDHKEEERAELRGNIEILQRGRITIEPHRVRPPKG